MFSNDCFYVQQSHKPDFIPYNKADRLIFSCIIYKRNSSKNISIRATGTNWFYVWIVSSQLNSIIVSCYAYQCNVILNRFFLESTSSIILKYKYFILTDMADRYVLKNNLGYIWYNITTKFKQSQLLCYLMHLQI